MGKGYRTFLVIWFLCGGAEGIYVEVYVYGLVLWEKQNNATINQGSLQRKETLGHREPKKEEEHVKWHQEEAISQIQDVHDLVSSTRWFRVRGKKNNCYRLIVTNAIIIWILTEKANCKILRYFWERQGKLNMNWILDNTKELLIC